MSAPLQRGRATRTLRGRVSLLALGVIAGWLVVLAAGFDFALSSRLDHQVDDTLRVRAQAVSTIVKTQRGVIVGVSDSDTDRELESSIWVYAGKRPVARPRASPAVQRAADSLATARRGYASQAGRRFYVLPLGPPERRIGSVVAALETAPYIETKQLAILGSGVVTVLLLAGAYPVLRLAAGRALRPVEAMTRQAADWSVSAPAQRFGPHQQYAELNSLAVTLDGLLDRLAAVLRHERQLSAELSHELRTPLARMIAEIDLSLDEAPADRRDGLRSIRTSATSMDDIIDTLLVAARTELGHPVGHTNLDPILEQFTTSAAASPAVSSAATGLRVGVDGAVVARALGPVVDNAVRYATNTVRLDARRSEHGIDITVSNDGPPVPAHLAERIFEPGFRVDTADRHDGVGLGLALARRLARAVDGELELDTTEAATTFRLVLPAG